MGGVGHINDRLFLSLFLQILRAEIDAVVVAVGAAEGDESPEIVQVESVTRSEKVDDLALECQRVQMPAVNLERVSGVVRHRLVRAAFHEPVVKPFELDVVIGGVTEIRDLVLPDIGGVFVEPVPGRVFRGGTSRAP